MRDFVLMADLDGTYFTQTDYTINTVGDMGNGTRLKNRFIDAGRSQI